MLAGILLSGVVAGLALWRRALSPSGALAAVVVGTAIWMGGGIVWFNALMTFFATSTVLGRVGRAAKRATKREFSKGDRRDALQVLANGGVAAAAGLGAVLWPGAHWTPIFLGAMATANGDTWATELGVLSARDPFSLVRWRRVPRGTSGAVSLLGLAATVAGAAVVALPFASLRMMGVCAFAGTAGSLADSLLGATVQTRFYCPRCQRETEGARHYCGSLTEQVGGWWWFGNDAVNLAATVFGAWVAWRIVS